MAEEQKEITKIEDIELLVHSFYDKVKIDDKIGPVFNAVIEDRWDVHLEKMVRFWQTVLLKDHTYYGSPFRPHMTLPVGKEHFDRWLSLFKETIEENFEGEKAKEALWRANKMAEMFLMKIKYYQENKSKPIL